MTVISLPSRDLLDAASGIADLEVVLWDLKEAPPREDIALVVPPYLGNPSRLKQLASCAQLRAVQLVTAGYEHAVPYLPRGVQLANGAGIHDTSTAELALALTLAAQRGIPEAVRAAGTGEWLHLFRPSLADRRVLLIGYGAIGVAIAKRLIPFEVELTAVASRARAGDDLVDTVHGIDELPTLLPTAEIVIVIVPLTESTNHLVNAQFLAALPDDALVVNVARGGVIDTDALLAECQAGRLRAALDVTDPEPLPADHPLWSAPGVLITPHVGGNTTAFLPRAQQFLRRELTAFAAGGDLSNVVSVGG